MVSTEGTGQIISGTVTDSGGQQATASVTLNIDETPPTLSVSSPTDGEVLTSSQLTATGNVSDALSGVTSFECNQVSVGPPNGGFSCAISLNPGLNLVVVQATDAAGNIALTKMHVTLNAPFPPPASLTISPTNVLVGVGQTQQFSAVDDQGRMRSDATWTVSNSNIATITTDSSPVLSGVAVGQVTLTANVQGVQTSEQVTITSSSPTPGGVEWSVPQDGYTVQNVTPAVPSEGGPGFYDLEYYTNQGATYSEVRAFTTDGQQMWQQSAGLGQAQIAADGSGGLLVHGGPGLMDLDAQTGSVVWEGTFGVELGTNEPFSMRPDGNFVVEGTDPSDQMTNLYWLNGATGQILLLPSYQGQDVGNCAVPLPTGFGLGPNSITTDSSGNTYVTYLYMNVTETLDNCSSPTVGTQTVNEAIRLLTIDSGGAVSDQSVNQATASRVCIVANPGAGQTQVAGTFLQPGITNPDGQAGVLVTWSQYAASPTVWTGNPREEWPCLGGSPTPPPTEVSHISPSGNSQYELPLSDGGLGDEFVLGQNGTAFMGGLVTPGVFPIIAFDVNTGQVEWTYTDADGPLLAATSDGGVLFMRAPLCSDRIHACPNVTELDSTGTPHVLIPSLPEQSYPPAISWQGQMLQWTQTSGVAGISIPTITLADSYWAVPGGNETGNGLAIEQVQTNQTQGTTHQIPDFGSTLNVNDNSIEILTTVSPSEIFSKYIQTYAGAQAFPDRNTIATVPQGTNVTASGQIVTFTLQGVLGSAPMIYIGLGQGPFSVQIERFDTSDPTQLIMSAVTLQGHPVEGWRYWRVYSNRTNDVVIETGAADLPGPNAKSFWGYYYLRENQIEIWHQYLEFILSDIKNLDPNAKEGHNLATSPQGEWNAEPQSFILNMVCQAPQGEWCD